MHLSGEGSFSTFLKACLKTSFMKAGVSPTGLISRQDALLCALQLKPPGEKPTGLSKSIKGRIRLGFHLKGGFSQWRLFIGPGSVQSGCIYLKVCLLKTKKKQKKGRNESRPFYKMTPNLKCKKSASFSWPEKPSTSLHALISSCGCWFYHVGASTREVMHHLLASSVNICYDCRSQKEHHPLWYFYCGETLR